MKKYIFGADVGGTTVKLGLFEGETMLEKWEIPTNVENNGRAVLPDVAASIQRKLEEREIPQDEVIGIGIDVPGPVDPDGNVRRCVNLGWGYLNVEDDLSALTGLSVKGANDANVATLGEMWKGGGMGYDSIVMITLGTGVGGGVVIDGEILPGSGGAAGEIGHICVNPAETAVCGCGRRGCLEQYTSANGIARVARNYLAEHEDEETCLRQADPVTSKDVLDGAKAGDPVCVKLLEQLGKTLGIALGNVAVNCDPQAFVIGGGVSKAGPILTDTISRYYEEYCFHAVKGKPILLAKLGNDAGMYGCVKMALDAFGK